MSTVRNGTSNRDARGRLEDDIVCGVSGSRLAYEAVRQAAALAGPGARLTLVAVTAVRGAGQQRTASLAPARARRALDHARRLAARAGIDATAEIDEGAPVAETLLQRARDHRLLAIGPPSMSRVAHLLVGGTATAAAHVLPASVLVARRPPAHVGFAERILVATDALERSDGLVDYATELARERGAELILVHATHDGSAEQAARLAGQVERVTRALGGHASVRIERGRAHDLILAVAASERCSLIVLSSRRLSGLRALGSVSERIVHDARCSVLVVRPEDLAAS
jgi:nucleotide-binding universal stress UspA family protein